MGTNARKRKLECNTCAGPGESELIRPQGAAQAFDAHTKVCPISNTLNRLQKSTYAVDFKTNLLPPAFFGGDLFARN
jgi:hypothetical protein